MVDENDALFLACKRDGEPQEVWLARYELVRDMLRARTRAEINAVNPRVSAWLARHPDDWTVLSAGEQLAMMEDGLDFTGR